jgi:Lon protease-like protein
VSDRLPIFPLGTVLFPGLVLPLHIFEERYRRLIGDLLDKPADEPRRFGVVAIKLGHEVGTGAARELESIGCTADIQAVTSHDDGRYDIVTAGGSRFRIDGIDSDLPYLRADVTPLPDEPGPQAEHLVEHVTALFRDYCGRLTKAGADIALPAELPRTPVRLSFLVAAAMILDHAEKQALLEAEHAAARLDMARELLRRENRLLGRLLTVPGTELLGREVRPN